MSVKVENLSIAYRMRSGDCCPVEGVSFAVADGEIMGLAGESGCGKSTLGNSLIFMEGRMQHLGGRVVVDGQVLPIEDFRAMRPYRMAKVSLVPQYAMNALNPTRRISKLTTDLLRSHGVREGDVLEEMKRRIRLVGLDEDVLSKYSFELSGGMRQRVTIILSTLLNPSLLIADEVTSALDVSTQRAVGEMLIEFRDRGFVKSVIAITHDLSILAQIADSILIMYAGRLAEKASATDIVNAPLHPYTQMLLASLPEVGVRYDKTTLTGIPGRPPSLVNPPRGCRFADRCPFARAKCAETPPFEEVRPGRHVACWKVSQGWPEGAPEGGPEGGGALLDVRLLVADEIISMLDASTRVDILNLLISLKRTGLAILFITHDLSLGNYVSDRTVILRHGAIVEMGDTVKVFGNPRHPYTRNLLTAVPELHQKWQPSASGNGTRPAGRAPLPDTAFDPPPLTEYEENHLVAMPVD